MITNSDLASKIQGMSGQISPCQEIYVKEFGMRNEERVYALTRNVSEQELESKYKSAEEKQRFFRTEFEFKYTPFNLEYGPLSIADIIEYHRKVNWALDNEGVFFHALGCPKSHGKTLQNSLLLIGSFFILQNPSRPLTEILEKCKGLLSSVENLGFIDVFSGTTYYKNMHNVPEYMLSLLDCLSALKKSLKFNLLNFAKFDLQKYRQNSQPNFGDLNWIVEGKLLAFAGPYDCEYIIDKECTGSGKANGIKKKISTRIQHGPMVHPATNFLPIFKRYKVGHVLRLNTDEYDSKEFVRNNIQFHELQFPDCYPPSPQVCIKFLDICLKTLKGGSETQKSIAVHCKSGIGRTGTLIAIHLMSFYGFKAGEAIAWCRLCRQGSVLGIQQNFLIDIEDWVNKISQLRKELEMKNDGSKKATFEEAAKSLDQKSSAFDKYTAFFEFETVKD